MIKILIVEDDIYISKMLKELLETKGYQTVNAYSGTEALMSLEKEKFNLVILDLMLPGLSGKEVLNTIGNKETLPIIAISAIEEVETKIDLLRNGADDYITKPFDNGELLARIENVLKRYSNINNENKLIFKDISLNEDTMEVKVNDSKINLTRNEFNILRLLMKNPNKVYSKNNIFEMVWNENYIGEDNIINVHISNIRKKLLSISKEEYIETVWGIGFKMKSN